jgi:uncharacterized protein (DUF1015 family)
MPRMPEPNLRLDPLRAWRFVAGKVSGLGAVTSPPYDVLEPALVRRLTESDLHNMVRLILPRDASIGPSRYDEAAGRLRSWQDAGVVVRDPSPALYVYEQRVGTARLCGLVGSLGLDPSAQVVLPHEDVMPWPVDDRYDLMRATEADLEPILLAYSGGGAASDAVDAARDGEPWVVATTDDGAEHVVWRIADPVTLAEIAADLSGREALIADGHHRYAAYLRMQRRSPGGPTDRGLAMLVDQEDTPLFLGPIHRILTGVGLDDLATAAEVVGARLDLVDQAAAVHALGPATLVATDGRRWATVKLHLPEDRAAVEQLHDDLVPALPRGPQRIEYHHSVDATLSHLRKDSVAVLMPAPDVDLVLKIAADDRLLPEKATSFQPKPSVGVLIRSLRDE